MCFSVWVSLLDQVRVGYVLYLQGCGEFKNELELFNSILNLNSKILSKFNWKKVN